jgi:indolepyruvate ferredoxin oxidoreductase
VDPATGEPAKRKYGAWMLSAMRLLAKLKGLRGTALDPFGYAQERRAERQLIAGYERLLDEIVERLSPETLATAVELAGLPEHIRGYGPVKAQSLAKVLQRQEELVAFLRDPAARAARQAAAPIKAAA